MQIQNSFSYSGSSGLGHTQKEISDCRVKYLKRDFLAWQYAYAANALTKNIPIKKHM